jgi:hypothetical protein
MRHFLGCIALLGFVSPAFACLNDRELLGHEREFRSQYQETTSQPPPPATSAEPKSITRNQVLFGGGAALLIGALALTYFDRRVRS